MAEWITRTAQTHAREGDTAIFMQTAPMGHMLTHLRPALNHSFLGMGRSAALRREAVVQMIRTRHEPKVAYRFLRFPAFYPVPGSPGEDVVGRPVVYAPNDPVDWYLTHRMRLVDRFEMNGTPWIELYAAPDTAPSGAP